MDAAAAGPRWARLAACVGLAAAVWLSPAPAGLETAGWRTFAVFVGVVSGFLLRPLPMGPIVLLGLLALILSKTVPLDASLAAGFGDTTVWLVTLAFLLASAVERTGLGRRIALHLLRILGRSPLGLGYAISATELVLGPFVPSNTARGGGILAPIVNGLAVSLGARTEGSARRAGAFLTQTGSHSNLVCSAMFLTGMAGNLLLVPEAKKVFDIDWDFITWLQGSIVPGLLGMLLVPPLLCRLEPIDAEDVRRVRSRVAEYFAELGPPSPAERRLVLLLLTMLAAWSTKQFHGAHPTTVTLAGVLALVLLRVQSWREIAGTTAAWDAMVWLGGYVALADALGTTGFTPWFRDEIAAHVDALEPIPTTLVLGLVYFLTMLFFSQLTAHVAALGGVFLALAHSAGSPPMLALAIISYFTCLCGTLTPWSSGPVIIYYEFGYVSAGRWMRNGAAMALVQIAVWLGAGMAWWKFLGWW